MSITLPFHWYLLLVYTPFLVTDANSETIEDPIANHLNVMTDGRLELSQGLGDLKSLVNITTLDLDIDGNGVDELFVGHQRPWTGDVRGVYWSVYQRSESGYIRVSSQTRDLRLVFGGEGDWYYCGRVDWSEHEGLLIVETQTRIDPLYYETARFIYLNEGKLHIDNIGPIDTGESRGKQIYEQYLTQPRKLPRNLSNIIHLSSGLLTQRGYNLSYWKSKDLSDRSTGYKYESSQVEDDRMVRDTSGGSKIVSPSSTVVETSNTPSGKLASQWLLVVGCVVLLGILLLIFRFWKKSRAL